MQLLKVIFDYVIYPKENRGKYVIYLPKGYADEINGKLLPLRTIRDFADTVNNWHHEDGSVLEAFDPAFIDEVLPYSGSIRGRKRYVLYTYDHDLRNGCHKILNDLRRYNMLSGQDNE